MTRLETPAASKLISNRTNIDGVLELLPLAAYYFTNGTGGHLRV